MKSFIAADMRTALRLVREEFGEDAVILSNRRVPQGIELVAATEMPPAAPRSEPRAAGSATVTSAAYSNAAPAGSSSADHADFDVESTRERRGSDAGWWQMQQELRAMREVDVSADGRWAIGRDLRGYISDYKRPAADLYRVNTTTGERTLIAKNQLIGASALGISPDGNNFVYWKDNKFQVYNFDAGATKTLGSEGKDASTVTSR